MLCDNFNPAQRRQRKTGTNIAYEGFLWWALVNFPPLSLELCRRHHLERPMANNKNPTQKQPGEKEPGKFHYNPGNMSGKTIGSRKDESEQQANARSRKAKTPRRRTTLAVRHGSS
jgi:hypothetical protein